MTTINNRAAARAARGLADFAERYDAVARSVGSVIRGKPDAIRLSLTALFAEGHLLIEDVPGTGKTSLARAIAASVEARWNRIQFTPDLLPSDVSGVSIYNQGTKAFEFHEGPIFANIVLADEINRASPKTQSALLEVMEEQRVTVDGHPYPVPRPFLVIATQNPVEMEGTYELPEAQRDRFLLRTAMGYPDAAAEAAIVMDKLSDVTVDELQPVLSLADVATMIDATRSVEIAPAVVDYLVALVAATRNLPDVRLGASPRGSVGLQRACRVWAAADGRSFVTPEDVKDLAVPVLAHRVILTPEAEVRGRTAEEVIGEILRAVPVPRSVRTD